MLHTLDLFSTIVFAASGILLAYERRHNHLVAGIYAFLTALGGGTLRDLLLHRPIFWQQNPNYVWLVCIIAALLIGRADIFCSRREQLYFLDAIGMATFTVVGAQVTMETSPIAPASCWYWLLMALMGTMTATGGGVIRDLLSLNVPCILKEPCYTLVSLLGGWVYALLVNRQDPPLMAIGIPIIAIVGWRLLSKLFIRVEPSAQSGETGAIAPKSQTYRLLPR